MLFVRKYFNRQRNHSGKLEFLVCIKDYMIFHICCSILCLAIISNVKNISLSAHLGLDFDCRLLLAGKVRCGGLRERKYLAIREKLWGNLPWLPPPVVRSTTEIEGETLRKAGDAFYNFFLFNYLIDPHGHLHSILITYWATFGIQLKTNVFCKTLKFLIEL